MTGDGCRTVSEIRMTHAEADAILAACPGDPERLKWSCREEGWLFLQAAPCPLLEGNQCSVHAVRPYKCRQFGCYRAPGEAFDPSGPLGCANLSDRLTQDRETRRAYPLNQRKAGRWALTMGWKGTEE